MTQRIYEDKILNKVYLEEMVERVRTDEVHFTDLEYAVLLFLYFGYSPKEIMNHFEYPSHQNIGYRLRDIRRKLKLLGDTE